MKIWYDISGIYNWTGNFTGIQRIVYNLGKELEASSLSVGFFIYHSGRFSEVGFTTLNERLIELNAKEIHKAKANSITLGKLRHHGILAVKNTVRGTRIEPQLRFLYVGIRKGYHLTKGHHSVPDNNLFKADDIVVVVDGNWQFRGYEQALTSLRTAIGFKLAHFVNDLVAIRNPALVNKGADKIIGKYFKHIFANCDILIAISESTKNDIEWFMDRYSISNKPKISVLVLGDNISPDNKSFNKLKTSIPEQFILSVGTFEIRKNYMAFYYVYKLAQQNNSKLPHLVIVGRKGWMADETYSLLTQDTDINQHITILNNADDKELDWLYRNCLFTVFPSFYEGWGLPISESLAHGKCCISSNTSSMPEVGGALVNYVSPFDTSGFLNEIVNLTNKDVRLKLEKKIKAEYNAVTWQHTFMQFRDIITLTNE